MMGAWVWARLALGALVLEAVDVERAGVLAEVHVGRAPLEWWCVT